MIGALVSASRVWTLLGRPGPNRFVAALALSIGAAIASVALLGLSGWFLTAAALAGAAGAGVAFNHLFPSAGVRGFAFARVVLRYVEQLVGHDATLRLSAALRPTLFARLARSTQGLAPARSEDLSLLIEDVEAVEGAWLRLAVPAVGVAAAMIVAAGVAALADPFAAAAVLALALATAVWIPSLAGARSRRADALAAAEREAARGRVADVLACREELAVLGRLEFEAAAALDRALRADRARDALEAPYRGLASLISAGGAVAAAIVLWRASEPATAAAAALAALAAFDAAASLVRAAHAASRAKAAAERVESRLIAPEAPPQPPLQPAAAATEPLDVLPIRAVGLEARAGDGPRAAADFVIEAGRLLQITGPSGAGKTTLLETLARLRAPAGGALTYAGRPAETLRTAAVLSRLAVAPQFPVFLPGALREQLTLGRPDAGDVEIRSALEAVRIDAAVFARPEGLDLTGDSASTFSGGEARRLGLARALLADPQVLLLDEPFAGLEPDLAAEVAAALARWALDGDRALVTVEHAPLTWPLPTTRIALARA